MISGQNATATGQKLYDKVSQTEMLQCKNPNPTITILVSAFCPDTKSNLSLSRYKLKIYLEFPVL